jgi:thiamine-phosphate pyrophosphorylase
MSRIDFSLYLITDRHQTAGRPLVTSVRDALQAGVRAVQLREKDLPIRPLLDLAQELRGLTRKYGARLLINDRIDVAMAVEADGVQLRADSLPVSVARRLLGADRVIGLSAHTLQEILMGQAQGADFAVLGPVYETPSKRIYGPPIGLAPLEEAGRHARIPIFAIGGVTAERVGELRRAGAFGVAVISSVLSADVVETATGELLQALDASPIVAREGANT